MPIVLTVVLWAAQPLRGSVRDPGGEEREFVGWIGLAQILGELADRDALPAKPDPWPASPRRAADRTVPRLLT